MNPFHASIWWAHHKRLKNAGKVLRRTRTFLLERGSSKISTLQTWFFDYEQQGLTTMLDALFWSSSKSLQSSHHGLRLWEASGKWALLVELLSDRNKPGESDKLQNFTAWCHALSHLKIIQGAPSSAASHQSPSLKHSAGAKKTRPFLMAPRCELKLYK